MNLNCQLPTADCQLIWDLLEQIPDPEIPVINIVELGVVRNVEVIEDKVTITITPTYSGCPAMKAIEDEIVKTLQDNHIKDFQIKTTIYPAWTTDWISDASKEKLRAYGIAPPEKSTEDHLISLFTKNKKQVSCPFCNSTDTKLTSAFGSTACKALHYCNSCQQPFEEFKCH